MNKWTRYLLLMPVLLAQALSSCSLIDEPEDNGDSKTAVSLALSFAESSRSHTRMATNVVQEGTHRDIQNILIVPFAKQGEIVSGDRPRYYETSGREYTYDKQEGEIGKLFYYRQSYFFMPGVASFLVYGQTVPVTPTDGSSMKSYNGSLIPVVDGVDQTTLPSLVTPASFQFRPEPIYNPDPVENHIPAPDEAGYIADYLTYITGAYATVGTTTTSWKNSTNSWLRAVYQNFINQGNQTTSVLAGSARNVKAYVSSLYQSMKEKTENDESFADGTMSGAIAKAVMTRIKDFRKEVGSITRLQVTFSESDGKVTSLGLCDSYPNNYDLPDGSAVLLWNTATDKFEPQTETTTLASINTISRYAYPAELYYFGNSRIKTHNEEISNSLYEGATTWAAVLERYDYDDAIVTTSTKAVAIKEPLQYAVARLSAKVYATLSTLADANGQGVAVGASSFPITGIIVDKQRPVGFDFKPESDAEADERFVYDSHLNTNTGNTNYCLATTEAAQPFLHTLVLQNWDGEDVTVILELQNNSGGDFKGENGMVYNGTKFYLVGYVKAAEGLDTGIPDEEKADVSKRVFTHDHTTSIGMKVNTLAHAYNVLPNILSGRLEVGVEINCNWIAATPEWFVFE